MLLFAPNFQTSFTLVDMTCFKWPIKKVTKEKTKGVNHLKHITLVDMKLVWKSNIKNSITHFKSKGKWPGRSPIAGDFGPFFVLLVLKRLQNPIPNHKPTSKGFHDKWSPNFLGIYIGQPWCMINLLGGWWFCCCVKTMPPLDAMSNTTNRMS
jgi:hypothetical protein